jgi:hypothetical protein
MARHEQRVMPASKIRSELTAPGDVRSAVAFQNDVNALIALVAQIEEARAPGPGGAQQVIGFEAPFGFLPPRPIDLGQRKRSRQAEAAVEALILTVDERRQQLLQVR